MRQRELLLLVCAIRDADRQGGCVAELTCPERRLLGVTSRRNTFGLVAASCSRTAKGVLGVSGGAAEVVRALAGTERHVRQRGVGGTV